MNVALPWRRALVVGMGASGRAAASLLAELGLEVRGYDRSDSLGVTPNGVSLWLGEPEVPAGALEDVDLVVLSPGLSPVRPRELAREHCPGAAIVGELGLGLAVLERLGAQPKLCLVTGTNGKSTVTSMIGHSVSALGEPVFVGGNLGPALCDHVRAVAGGREPAPAMLVLECSSYQLETLGPVATDVAMVLNISPDHLDRYASMDDYAATKAKVFSGLRDDGLALLDAVDARTPELARHVARGTLHWVGGPSGPRLAEDGSLHLGDDLRFPREDLQLAGRHNAKNALFAMAAALHLGVPWPAVCERMRTFEGLPHRMVHVATIDDVAYYNDSKATNVASVLASLDGFERPFVLIAGGRAKGEDLDPLRELLRRRGRGLVAIGESASRFLAMADGAVPTRHAIDMQEAVSMARDLARAGDAIVLSPACASWDMYANYGARGQAFVDAVLG